MIWVPYTNTNGQWIASKLLQGFFGAPIESLCEISMTDIVSSVGRLSSEVALRPSQHFTHNRGSYIALYGFFLAGSSFLAPILAGFINDGQGWKWVLVMALTSVRWSASLHGVVLVRNPLCRWSRFSLFLHGRNKLPSRDFFST